MPTPIQDRSLFWLPVAAILLLAVGVAVAMTRLPEWRSGSLPPSSRFANITAGVAARGGVRLDGEPRVMLRSRSWLNEDSQVSFSDPSYELLGPSAADWLAREGRLPVVQSSTRARWPSPSPFDGELSVLFSTQGLPLAVRFLPNDPFTTVSAPAAIRDLSRLRAMLAPQSAGSAPREVRALGQKLWLIPLEGTEPPETLMVAEIAGAAMPYASRLVGTVDWIRSRYESLTLWEILRGGAATLLVKASLTFATAIVFAVLLLRRRIDLRSGLALAAFVFLSSVGGALTESTTLLRVAGSVFSVILKSFALFVLWSAAESWVRATVPGFRTSLDALRAGRLGPKGGRALLAGWSIGTALAGLWLSLLALATMIPGVAPVEASIHLPLFGKGLTPVEDGAARAGIVVLAICMSLQLPLIRRIPLASTLLGGVFLASRVPLDAFWVAIGIGIIFAACFVRTYATFGLTALVAAAVTSSVLPAAVYGLRHFHWLAAPAVFLSTFAVAPLVLGVVGIRRPEQSEEGAIRLPAFVRRIEQESRLRYEMDLLARTQLGLLPSSTPNVDGYEIAARSALATEAGGDLYDFIFDDEGRLWIAAGDVSGHGYSCAIAQAMTKAGLASLVEAHRSPKDVLHRLDRVLRTSGASETFTSLALLRLEPASGSITYSNAGHPYPLLTGDGNVREIEMPSLPLGKGPPRTYTETTLDLPRGAALILCSDGLSEAFNEREEQFGFDRLAAEAARAAGKSANAMVDALFASWRQHIGQSAQSDDTTVVVIRRVG